jgi:uncharacterized membrane protein (DUF2068 family)
VERPSWLVRLWRDLGARTEGGDTVIGLIIAERLIKSSALIILAITFVVLGRTGVLTHWAIELNDQLNLDAGRGLITRLLARALEYVVRLPHQTLLAMGIVLYAGLEATEGIGLWLRRRWAEYLTVLATAIGIPFEVYEVSHRVTPFRVGALLLNAIIVVYLAWRKRLFVDV